MTMVPEAAKAGRSTAAVSRRQSHGVLSPVRTIVFGVLIIGFLVFEPHGLEIMAAHPPLFPPVALPQLSHAGTLCPINQPKETNMRATIPPGASQCRAPPPPPPPGHATGRACPGEEIVIGGSIP